MTEFPRTTVGGVSLPRMIVGTNWLLGATHRSAAKDKFVRDFQTSKNIADILTVGGEYGINAIFGWPTPVIAEGVKEAEQKTGKKIHWFMLPGFNMLPGGREEMEPERMLDHVKELGCTFCLPHQYVTDALMDLMHKEIRDLDKYTKMIRDRGMIPGLSTHMPQAIPYADKGGYDIETYVQIYNCDGFMMQMEIDWVMRIIQNAKKPVVCIKPMAAGQLLPPVGLAFVWNTIRDQDMVCVGVTTPDEMKEDIEMSLDFLAKRVPDHKLQETRSKTSLSDDQTADR
jgi:hypothetical protein